MIGRGNRSTRRKPAPLPLCPPQTPHGGRMRTRAAAVGSQRLTAWATPRPRTNIRPSSLEFQSGSHVRVHLHNNNNSIFRYIMSYTTVKVGWRFGGAYHLHLRGQRVSQARNQREAGSNPMPPPPPKHRLWERQIQSVSLRPLYYHRPLSN
jgi:hypothetical protein